MAVEVTKPTTDNKHTKNSIIFKIFFTFAKAEVFFYLPNS